MSVYENLAFGLRVRKPTPADDEIDREVEARRRDRRALPRRSTGGQRDSPSTTCRRSRWDAA